MVCDRIVRLVLAVRRCGFWEFWNIEGDCEREDEEKKKYERARSQWICESECWDAEIRWIWGIWM